jgi:hypothetical protein
LVGWVNIEAKEGKREMGRVGNVMGANISREGRASLSLSLSRTES